MFPEPFSYFPRPTRLSFEVRLVPSGDIDWRLHRDVSYLIRLVFMPYHYLISVQDPIPPTLHICFLTTTTSGRGSAVVTPTPFETERAANVQSVLTSGESGNAHSQQCQETVPSEDRVNVVVGSQVEVRTKFGTGRNHLQKN